ncbi:MAG: TonB-dependent receptor [bacterium]
MKHRQAISKPSKPARCVQKSILRIIIFGLFISSPAFLRGGIQTAEKTTGRVKGQIIDEASQSPLFGVNVMIEGTLMGAAADAEGRYLIERIPPGSYNLRFRMIGYEMRVVPNVVVYPNRTTFLNVELKSTVLETEGVVVTAGYFHEAKDAVVSNRSMDFEEVRGDPGSVEDVQRAVQALPSVVSASDQDNEIIVRGGMPGENLFVMDNIEIPNPNHFAYQGTSGGPINMINTYFVRRVDFYAGAFPVRYGDKASSVLDISLRDGNRENVAGNLYLGMSGAGAMIEGPIVKGKGAWILSARKSFLDLIIASTGLTAVPKYYNLQGKATYDLSPKHRLILNGIFGDDRITIEDEGKGGYSRGAENVKARSHQYAFGGTLRSFLGDLGVSNLTLSQTLNHWNHDVYDENKISYYTNLSTEIERALKVDVILLPSKGLELNFGGIVKAVTFDHNEWFHADSIFTYDTSVDPHQKTGLFAAYPEWNVVRKENTVKLGGYGQTKLRLIPRLTMTAGIRLDYMRYIRKGAVDPRFGLSYQLDEVTSVNLAVGRQSQSPAYIALTSNEDNRDLNYKRTQQVILGLDRLFREDIRGTLEIFYKDYRNVPIPVAWTTADPFDRSDGRLTNEGHGFAKGVEFFLQKKMTRNYHFTVSYAYSVSKGYDPRFQEYYNWDFDYRYMFTFINGMRFDFHKKDWYRRLSGNIFYKIFAWILPLADRMDISVRWRYLGGRPYTRPMYYEQLHYWAVNETSPVNTNRYPSYHRLDLRIDRRFMFKGWDIITYFDVMNVYGRNNIWEYTYNDDGSVDEILQWKVFPVGGLSIEF